MAINQMEHRGFSHALPLSRRALLASAAGAVLAGGWPRPASAQTRAPLALKLIAKTIQLKAGLPASSVWALEAAEAASVLRFKKGEDLQVSLSNESLGLSTLNFVGFDGASAAEPLTGQPPLAAGGRAAFALPLRQAGTFLLDARLLGDGQDRPSPVRALVVDDPAEPPQADRDEVLLFEDWRIQPDGRALAPGTDPGDAATVYTVNGLPSLDLRLKPNERVRLRVINGCQRSPIGLRIENHALRVIAIDSQPSEPFPARDGQLVLAPGSRIDALVDATQTPGSTSNIVLHDGTTPRIVARLLTTTDAPLRAAPLANPPPLSSAHLPAQLDLKNALRVELQLDAKAPWSTPAEFTVKSSPLFQAKRNRTVVMAITNPTAAPVVFRLHGHHFRLLDRLDDGWKPFWLDTLLVDARQTQRIAFLAEYPGRWLIESCPVNWSARRMVRSYAVS